MSSLPQLLTRSDVARYLGVDLKHITWWVWALRERRRYYEFSIDRRTGGRPRTIRAPIKPIKDLQRGLLPLLNEAYAARSHVHGFVRGRSPITNATVHRNQRWILRVDLTDFFPSIHFGRVLGLFRAAPFDYPDPVASLLGQICCHRNELPQGAPTSPVISNLVCRRLDKQLAAFAKAQHCHYTRYADDICFSSGRRIFPEGIATIVNGGPVLSSELRSIITTNDFAVNESKTRLMPRRQRQRVTGLVVNERLNVPREYARHLRAVLYIWDKYGEPDAQAAFERRFGGRNWPPEKQAAEFRLVVRGQLQYLGAVRRYDRIYQRLAILMTNCDPSFVATAPTWPEPGDVLYATEGPSDPLHLDAALRAFRSVGDFTELSLRQLSHQPPKNDDRLWRWLQQQKDVPSQIPRLGIFDADSGFAKAIGPTGWSHLGNGTVAVVLSPPPWHPSGEPFCVELLYQRDVLEREDVDKRRVFARDEFDSKGLSADGGFQMDHPQRTTLIVADVHPVGDPQKSVALGKVAFGNAVWRGQSPYETVDFQGFRPTLERIWRAIATAQRWCI